MLSDHVSRLGAAAIVVMLTSCASGDLTLPDQDQPGQARPATLVVVSGDGQRGEAGTVLEEPITVRVLDDSAHAVPNAAVRFSFLGDFSGAALDPSSILTDEAGRASAIVRLGELVGEQVVVAEVANTQLPTYGLVLQPWPWRRAAMAAARRTERAMAATPTTMTEACLDPHRRVATFPPRYHRSWPFPSSSVGRAGDC